MPTRPSTFALLAPALFVGASAFAEAPIASGSTVEITDISPEDMFFQTRSALVGQSCTTTEDLQVTAPGFYGGAMLCGSAATYHYFYKVALKVVSGAAPPDPAGSGQIIGYGTTFTVLDISPEDAYYANRETKIGMSCVATGILSDNGGGFYGGPATCNGEDHYFYKASLQVTAAGSGGYRGDVLAGARFRVIGVSPEDAYYNDTTLAGLGCTANETLTVTGDGYYSGSSSCDGDRELYFYQVSLDLLEQGSGVAGGAVSGSGYTGPTLPKGTRVRITGVSPSDAFAPLSDAVVGAECTVKKKGLAPTGDGWFGGTVKCDKTKLVFYQISVEVLSF